MRYNVITMTSRGEDPFVQAHPGFDDLSAIIDISNLQQGLELREFVPPGTIQAMLDFSQHALQTDGIDGSVNGLPATVSRQAVACKIGDTHYDARIFRYSDTPDPSEHGHNHHVHLHHHEDSDKPVLRHLPGILFSPASETVDGSNHFVSHNPNLMKFGSYGGVDTFQLFVDHGGPEPRLNDPDDVKLAESLLQQIAEKMHAEDHARSIQAARDAQRAEAARREAEESDRQTRTLRSYQRSRRIRSIVKWGAGLTAVLSGIGAASFAIYNHDNQPSFQTAYDAHNYKLSGGTVVHLGQTASPAFAPELIGDEELNASRIPNIHYMDNGGFSPGLEQSPIPLTGQLRELVFGTGRCATVEIAEAPEDSVIRIWTDATNSQGQSIANQITFTRNLLSGETCWNKPKGEIVSGKPRIIFSLQPGDATKP